MAITNFDELTAELTYEEKIIVKHLMAGFDNHSKENPIKAPAIIHGMRQKGISFSEVRLRKMVNYIRRNGMLPVIATSDGYYCSYDRLEIEKQILSLGSVSV